MDGNIVELMIQPIFHKKIIQNITIFYRFYFFEINDFANGKKIIFLFGCATYICLGTLYIK